MAAPRDVVGRTLMEKKREDGDITELYDTRPRSTMSTVQYYITLLP